MGPAPPTRVSAARRRRGGESWTRGARESRGRHAETSREQRVERQAVSRLAQPLRLCWMSHGTAEGLPLCGDGDGATSTGRRRRAWTRDGNRSGMGQDRAIPPMVLWCCGVVVFLVVFLGVIPYDDRQLDLWRASRDGVCEMCRLTRCILLVSLSCILYLCSSLFLDCTAGVCIFVLGLDCPEYQHRQHRRRLT